MARTSNVAKRQKVEECSSCMESVLLNSDSLFKIALYLPADSLLNLALTCRRFGIAPLSDGGGNDSLSSLIEETVRRIVHDVATAEEMAALPGYDEDSWLSKYNYLQLLRAPLTFDQLVGTRIDYVEGNNSRVTNPDTSIWGTAISNNIMMAGKHYASFEVHYDRDRPTLLVGVMRPGKATQSALGTNPLRPEFYQHFTQRNGSVQYNNNVDCCMYSTYAGYCCSSDWEGNFVREPWDGMEELSSPFKIGMLLDLDEGTLSVYKDGRKLGVMKRGLAGHYCWVVSLAVGTQVTIKRATVPAS